MKWSILVGVLGGDGGQLSGDHPKQGPNSQLEGLRRRHVALTDQILQIAQGRTGCPLADGRISSAVVPPSPLLYICLALTSNLTMSSLFLYLTVCLPLGFSAGSQAIFKKTYSLPVKA